MSSPDVQRAQLADDGDRDLPYLRRIRGELPFVCGVPPQQGEGGWVLAGHGEQGPGAQAAAAWRGQLGPQLGAQVVEDVLEDLPVELLLRFEVAVDDELGDAAGGGDIVHGRLGETGRRKGPRRAVEDGGPSFGAGKQLALDLYTRQVYTSEFTLPGTGREARP